MIELPNRADGLSEYRMEASDIMAAVQGLPPQAIGVWHTHPGGLIGPSTGDMRNRPDEEVPMLVVTLTAEGPVPTWF